MYGRQGSSTSGDRHDRHQHHRGKSTHSTRDRGKKHRESIRKEKDAHGSRRGDSNSGEGGGRGKERVGREFGGERFGGGHSEEDGGGGRGEERVGGQHGEGGGGRRGEEIVGGRRGEEIVGGERGEETVGGRRGEERGGGRRGEEGSGGRRGGGGGSRRGKEGSGGRRSKEGSGGGGRGKEGGGSRRGKEGGGGRRAKEGSGGGGRGKEGSEGGGGEEGSEEGGGKEGGSGRHGEEGGGEERGRGGAGKEGSGGRCGKEGGGEEGSGGGGEEGSGGGGGEEGSGGGGGEEGSGGGGGVEGGNEFILHEKLSPPALSFCSGGMGGGFEIYMPVSSSSIGTNNSRRFDDHWGSFIELRTMSPNNQPPKVQLWQKDWKPGPLSCTIPRTCDPPPPPAATLHPEETERVSSALDHPRDRHGNNLVLHCLDLQHYIQEITDLLAALPDNHDRDPGHVDALPDKPTRFCKPGSNTSLVLSEPLLLPDKLPSVSLNQHSRVQLLRKSTAAICSFSGYECSSPAAHNVLSDVLGNFLSNFTQLLRMNVNRNSGGRGCLGFQDALERSLHQTGMGGKDGVCGYWQTEVKGQARVLDMEADELRNLYFRSTILKERTQASSTVPRLSSPFSSLMSDAQLDQDVMEEEEEEEEEFPLDLALRDQSSLQEANIELPSASYSAVTSPDHRPLDMEGFISLLDDGPPRKRLRISSGEQE